MVRKQQRKIFWHPAFFEAIQLELAEYRDLLEFKYEYQLASEPLRIDLLVIKKPKDLLIAKNIARIFRAENICEYKSPEDYLSVKDFLKVYAYACLYSAITPDVDFSDITLTFVVNRYPRELVKYLTGVRGYSVTETCPGIHVVSGDYLPIQIIHSKKLSEADNLWLRSLTDDLESSRAGVILEEGSKRLLFTGAYLSALIRANPEAFLEVQTMARPTFEEVFTKAGLIPKWIEQGRSQGIEQGRVQGIEQGRVQGSLQSRLEIARRMKTMGFREAQISAATGLSAEDVAKL
jgi:hypothetical protein